MLLNIPPVSLKVKGDWQTRKYPHNFSNVQFHWSLKHRWNKEWKEAVSTEVMLNRKKLGKLPLQGIPNIKVVFKMTQPFDLDGAYRASKPLVDALKIRDGCGVIIDDSPKDINLTVETKKVAHKAEEGVYIEL